MACAFSGSELLIRRMEFVPKTDLSEVIDTAAECREDMATVFYKDTLRTTPADWRTLHITEGQLYDKWNAKWTVENTLPCRGRETWKHHTIITIVMVNSWSWVVHTITRHSTENFVRMI